MPCEMPLRDTERETVVQNALHVLVFEIFLVHVIGIEESGRRQLLGVSDDDGAFCASQGADRLRGGHLRRLVENNHVEHAVFRLQILRYRDRAHQKTGRDYLGKLGNLLEQLSQSRASEIALIQPLEIDEFETQTPLRRRRRETGNELGADTLAGELCKFVQSESERFRLLLLQSRGETG